MSEKNFAVIHVDRDYDFIDGVECLFTSETEAESETFMEKKKEEIESTWIAREKYIEDFVDKIEIPENLSYQEWMKFLSKDFIFLTRDSCTTTNFKKQLKNAMRNGYGKNLESFNPPQQPRLSSYDIFIVPLTNQGN